MRIPKLGTDSFIPSLLERGAAGAATPCPQWTCTRTWPCHPEVGPFAPPVPWRAWLKGSNFTPPGRLCHRSPLASLNNHELCKVRTWQHSNAVRLPQQAEVARPERLIPKDIQVLDPLHRRRWQRRRGEPSDQSEAGRGYLTIQDCGRTSPKRAEPHTAQSSRVGSLPRRSLRARESCPRAGSRAQPPMTLGGLRRTPRIPGRPGAHRQGPREQPAATQWRGSRCHEVPEGRTGRSRRC